MISAVLFLMRIGAFLPLCMRAWYCQDGPDRLLKLSELFEQFETFSC